VHEEHTNNMNISTGGSQEIEKKDYKQQDSPSLHISRALTLSHPGGFEVIQDACAVDWQVLIGIITSWLLVRVNVSRRQRY
jgi:hypothetical protein